MHRCSVLGPRNDGFVGRRNVFECVFEAKWAKVASKVTGNGGFDGRCGVLELLRLQKWAESFEHLDITICIDIYIYIYIYILRRARRNGNQ